MSTRRGRGASEGFTLTEVMVALLLSYLLVALALGVLARQRMLLGLLGERAERLAAARTARHLLGEEARASAGEGAWSAGGDSLALRSFRGHALVCGPPAGPRELDVSAAGVRAPDPEKDSVLLLRSSGEVVALALEDRWSTASPCRAAGGTAERWVLSDLIPADVVAARWFERGAYYLAAGALRYRRGLGGRQPLTPEVLKTPGSGFARAPDGRDVEVALLEEGTASPAWVFRMGAAR